MKLKMTGYDDNNEIIHSVNLEASEDFMFQKADEEVEKYINKYEELYECESCYGKFQEFSDRYPDKNLCKSCSENMREPLNTPSNE